MGLKTMGMRNGNVGQSVLVDSNDSVQPNLVGALF